VKIEACDSAEHPGWLRLRQALWPEGVREQHLAEMAAQVAAPQRYRQFVAYSPSSEAVGLIEASMRSDYVNGTETSPVAFVEGLYVVPQARRQGIAGSLVATVCDWARHVVYRALGFEDTERIVFFRRKLA